MAIVVVALALAGCGRDDEATTDKPTIRNADRWSEQDVIEAAGLTANDGGLSYTTTSGCDVSVVMTNAATVNLYSSAGDTVVTNPDGTAGVKTSGDEPACLAELERGLAALK